MSKYKHLKFTVNQKSSALDGRSCFCILVALPTLAVGDELASSLEANPCNAKPRSRELCGDEADDVDPVESYNPVLSSAR